MLIDELTKALFAVLFKLFANIIEIIKMQRKDT